jgi:hypothetical protein
VTGFTNFGEARELRVLGASVNVDSESIRFVRAGAGRRRPPITQPAPGSASLGRSLRSGPVSLLSCQRWGFYQSRERVRLTRLECAAASLALLSSRLASRLANNWIGWNDIHVF